MSHSSMNYLTDFFNILFGLSLIKFEVTCFVWCLIIPVLNIVLSHSWLKLRILKCWTSWRGIKCYGLMGLDASFQVLSILYFILFLLTGASTPILNSCSMTNKLMLDLRREVRIIYFWDQIFITQQDKTDIKYQYMVLPSKWNETLFGYKHYCRERSWPEGNGWTHVK